MDLLITIMDKTDQMSSLWYMDKLASRIMDSAVSLGLAWRISTTQAGWTKRGAALARRYMARKEAA
jgi:hypothetical protein